MNTDFGHLTQAVARNRRAQQELEGLQQPYEYAQQLRGAPQPQINPNTGYVSPLAVLADVVGKSTGRRDVRNLEEQQQVLRRTLGQTQAMEDQYELEGTQQERLLKKAREQRAKELHEHNLNTYANTAETWINPATGEKQEVIYNELNQPVFAHNKQPVPKDWIQWEDPDNPYNFRGKEWTPTFKKRFTEHAQVRPKLTKLLNDFKPSFSQIAKLPTRTLQRLIAKGNAADLLKYASKETDLEAREAALWWAEFARVYSLKERYELFGATLTNNELASWDEALGMMRGMNPTQVRRRLEQLHDDYTTDLMDDFNAQYVGTAHKANQAYLDMLGKRHGYMGHEGEYRFNAPQDEIAPWQYDEYGDPLQGVVDSQGRAVAPAQPAQLSPVESAMHDQRMMQILDAINGVSVNAN